MSVCRILFITAGFGKDDESKVWSAVYSCNYPYKIHSLWLWSIFICINGCMQYAYTCDQSHFASVCVTSRGGSWVSVQRKELERNDTFSLVFSNIMQMYHVKIIRMCHLKMNIFKNGKCTIHTAKPCFGSASWWCSLITACMDHVLLGLGRHLCHRIALH